MARSTKDDREDKEALLKLIVIILVVMIIVMVFSFYYYYKNYGYKHEDNQDNKHYVQSIEKTSEYTLDLGSFVTNLQGNDKKNMFIKANIHLGYNSESHKDEIEKKLIPIKDVVLSELRSFSVSELNTEGLDRFKKNSKDRANNLLDKSFIDDIYITDIKFQ